MATTAKSAHHIDPRSGYCAATKIFHSLRPAVQLPPPTLLLSFPSFAFSVLPSPLPSHPALLDAVSGEAISFPAFVSQVRALAVSLCSRLHLSRGDVAFVLAPARLDVPVLYFALLSIGAVVSPANPASTADEVARLVALSNSSVAFAVSTTAGKLADDLPTVLLDSPQFRSFLYHSDTSSPEAVVRQSDTAVIQYSSGTTGSTKATAVPHRCFIVSVAVRRETMPTGQQRVLLSAPIFHSMGFLQALAMPALGVTSVVMTATAAGAGTRGIMEIVERCRVTQMGAAPPLVVAMASGETVAGCDVTSLQEVTCGGAPLRDAVAMTFRKRFPGVLLRMGYGTTEAGPISIMLTPDECSRLGSVGRLHYGVEAKIVDHVTGLVLSAGQTGELYVRGHYVMKGYVGDDEANSAAFDSDGWLKTGDLCYIDRDGFVFIVDRLKELIKYKGYQVAPGELEQLLHSLPGIIDAVVIPYPNDVVGQIPMALIVREHGSNITETEIMEYIAKKIAPCKKVRKVMFVDSIPKSPTGKIVRRELTKSVICGSLSRL